MGFADMAGSHVVDNVELHNPEGRYLESCYLYRNAGQGKVEDLSGRVGPDIQRAGAWRGVAAADYDNDGRLEVAVAQLNRPAALFVRHGGPDNNWLILELRGTRSNRDGIGARVALTLDSGQVLYEHVTTANDISSASDKRVHFGLGKNGATSFEVKWPSGIVQRIAGPGTNRVLHVVEPER